MRSGSRGAGGMDAEQARHAHEAQLGNVLATTKAGLWEYEFATDTFTFTDSFYAIFRTTAATEGGYTMSSSDYARRFCHPEDACVVAREIAAARETRDPRFHRRLEHRILYADGGVGYIAVRFFVIKGEGGQTVRTYGVNQDITEYKKVEEALRGSEERYRLIVENAHDAIFIAQDGIIRFLNPRLSEISGYSREEITSSPFHVFIHPDDRAVVLENYRRRLKGESVPYIYTFRLVHKTGRVIWFELSAVVCTWEGRPASLNFGRDVTGQRKLDEHVLQGQKLEALGTLAGGVAHDFNNLLQVIHGYAEVLLGDATPEQKGYTDLVEIQQAAARGTSLARQLLTFGRKMESVMRPMDLNAAMRQARELLLRVIPRMIAIELNLDPRLKAVNADPGQIEQVLMNLAINSRDAMPSGGTLTITTSNCSLSEEECRSYPDLRPGPYVCLCVADTGRGIPADSLPHIFEPFYTTKPVGQGTGLGLAMVYGIVRNHRGIVACVSSPGKGARFMIHLPAVDAHLAALEPPSVPELSRGTESVLVVDDEPPVLRLAENVLRRAGYTVRTAVDGEQALDAYRAEPNGIDLVILDLIMPGMGGQACLTEILKLDPDATVLVASGFVPDGEKWDAVGRGAAAFIGKPYSIRSLLKSVRAALDTRLARGRKP